ncbi:hypothetical protein [Terribacillus saccharophilus]|uniref:hypothetical protein n=1 Tax=Terribacillus saccharophilus TaxID=361277 RepID=UPI0011405998|nr:hypothetical protein [Terribacillus saccharophilus]
MALQQTFTVPDSGVTITKAYICVEVTEVTSVNQTILLGFYINRDAKLNGKEPVYRNKHSFAPNLSSDSKNAFVQGYEYVKTLPEYQSAVDIFEEGQVIP